MKIKSGWIPGILATALASSCSSAPGSSAAPAKNSRVLWGVNLAGAEFADYQPLPGTYGENYGYPNEIGNAPKGAELGYYASKGLKLVRLPFRWERMQDGLNGPIRESELKQMRAFLEEARQGGFVVIPDCHNYARFYGPGDDKTRKEYIVGVNTDKAALGDLWKKLIPRLGDYGDVIWAWDIMNEPRNMGPGGGSEDEGGKQLWADVAQSTINAIRSVDKKTPILVAGYQYSPTDRWTQYSDKLKNLSDPSNKLIFEGHTYWDSDRSGTYNPGGGEFDFDKQTGGDLTRSVGALTDFVSWLRANKKQGFLGEFSVPAVAGGWQTLLSRFVIEVNARDSDVITGGTYWAGGSRWNNDETGAVLDGLHPPAMATSPTGATKSTSRHTLPPQREKPRRNPKAGQGKPRRTPSPIQLRQPLMQFSLSLARRQSPPANSPECA